MSSNNFSDWLQTLRICDYQKTKNRIISKCVINERIFSFWKTGRTKVPPLAQREIEKIAGKKIFK